MINPDQDYSDPDTGDIQSGRDWIADSKAWPGEVDARLASLTPVWWDNEGEYWIED